MRDSTEEFKFISEYRNGGSIKCAFCDNKNAALYACVSRGHTVNICDECVKNPKLNPRLNSDKTDREIWEEHIDELRTKPKSNSDSIPNQFSNRNENENPNEFWDKFQIKFESKFGVNSVKKAAIFKEKYPVIFYGILGALIQEYMEKNPEMLEEIFGRFLEMIGEKNTGNCGARSFHER